MDPENLMTWRVPCLECGRTLKDGAGIFCSNFLRRRAAFHPCLAAWCGGCYRAHPLDPFPVQRTLDEEEQEDLETEEKLDQRFQVGRNGDHVMGIPFECDLCHFRNVSLRNPFPHRPGDHFLLTCIRRANLDAMWSRETSTVTANLGRMRRDYHDAVPFMPLVGLIPSQGTHKVEDRVGMGIAVASLNASLRKGKYTDHLQWDSMRKTPTWYTNLWEAGSNYQGSAIFSNQDKKVYESNCPTSGRWFPRFMLGAKRRMGVIRKQNEALTVEQLLGLTELGECDYQKSTCENEKRDIENLLAFVIIGFCLSLRGEEVPLTCIEGLLTYWEKTRQHRIPHMMITLKGKFKGEQNMRWHCVPLADRTKSKIPTRRWVSRLLSRRTRVDGRKSGPLFANKDGNRASLGDFDPLFRDYLERLRQANPDVFLTSVSIEDYSLRRSLRRGATTTSQNNKVDGVAIDLINRWRKKEAAKGAEAGLSMRQVYTQVSQAVVAALRFSQSH